MPARTNGLRTLPSTTRSTGRPTAAQTRRAARSTPQARRSPPVHRRRESRRPTAPGRNQFTAPRSRTRRGGERRSGGRCRDRGAAFGDQRQHNIPRRLARRPPRRLSLRRSIRSRLPPIRAETRKVFSRPYLRSASKTFCDARPFTGMPFFCSKSAIADLVLFPIAPSGWPTS